MKNRKLAILSALLLPVAIKLVKTAIWIKTPQFTHRRFLIFFIRPRIFMHLHKIEKGKISPKYQIFKGFRETRKVKYNFLPSLCFFPHVTLSKIRICMTLRSPPITDVYAKIQAFCLLTFFWLAIILRRGTCGAIDKTAGTRVWRSSTNNAWTVSRDCNVTGIESRLPLNVVTDTISK